LILGTDKIWTGFFEIRLSVQFRRLWKAPFAWSPILKTAFSWFVFQSQILLQFFFDTFIFSIWVSFPWKMEWKTWVMLMPSIFSKYFSFRQTIFPGNWNLNFRQNLEFRHKTISLNLSLTFLFRESHLFGWGHKL